MESLEEETWDVVISGTGFSQSLLALALSRSDKRILHIDANDFYGEHEAALSLQDADAWVDQVNNTNGIVPNTNPSIFRNARIWRHADAEAQGLSFSRAYSLALAPQIIHTRSKLLSQLVSSRAYRQVEFLAVGSFFVFDSTDTASGAQLARIPSSREDVFTAQSIPSRAKRSLMKFLKFVMDYDSDEQKPVWQEKSDNLLSDFLTSEFKLDDNLRNSVVALTLALDGSVTVKDGLAIIHRHLTSIGMFGPGFCAVYPKWGGISEVAQVGCRAGAVGGAIYMLGTTASEGESSNGEVSLTLSNWMSIRTTCAVSSQQNASTSAPTVTKLIAVVKSPLSSLFELTVEGAPIPAVAVVAFPSGSLPNSANPVYSFVHSSDTGECPSGQSVIYLSTLTTPEASQILDTALESFLEATAPSTEILYKLSYEQTTSPCEPITTTTNAQGGASVFKFPSPSLSLSFDDSNLDAVQEAWKLIMKGEAAGDDQYLVFEDREGVGDDDDGDFYE
ncbi:GDP dissociation inhibitor-domain-containing protein [Xylariaceae sp. FL0255]|nr:GDP dissociation inhibitor-domain-containing protein [Xylariaceae sp. FL0255]